MGPVGANSFGLQEGQERGVPAEGIAVAAYDPHHKRGSL